MWQEREALIDAAKEGSGIGSMLDLWQALGMQRAKDGESLGDLWPGGWKSDGNPMEIRWKSDGNTGK